MGLKYHGITDLESWYKYAPPKGEAKQWKCTRSAMELARYITDNVGVLPDAIKKAIEITGEQSDQEFAWAAEYVTRLVGRGEGRNHDMAIFGSDLFVGVEAKADEPFDKIATQWLKDGGANKRNRLNDLCKIAFGEEYNEEEFGEIRYQLLSAFGGTVREAVKRGKKKALLLVLVFSNGKESVHAAQNNIDFDAFITKAGMGIIPIYDSEIKYAGKKQISGINTIIDKEERTIDLTAFIVKAVIETHPKCDNCGWKKMCNDKKRK